MFLTKRLPWYAIPSLRKYSTFLYISGCARGLCLLALWREAQLTPFCDLTRAMKVAGVSAASLALAFSANAATVKLGADGGGLVFDPANVTIKAGETVEWVNNVGFPHNVVFDEDEIPVSPCWQLFMIRYQTGWQAFELVISKSYSTCMIFHTCCLVAKSKPFCSGGCER